MTTPAWHADALRLRAEGMSIEKIARALDVSYPRAYGALNPAYAERQRKSQAAWERRKAADPVYREKRRAYFKRRYIRKCAQAEAAETGEPVEQVYERWGVA